MFIKKLIFIIFSVTAIQLPCIRKLNSYKAITGHVKQRYDEFYEKLKAQKLNPDLLKQLEKSHNDFEIKISKALEYYQEGSDQVPLIINADQRLKLCRTYINSSMAKLQDLEKLTLEMKSQLIKVLDQSGLPPNVIKQIEKEFYRVLNVIIIIDLSYQIGKGSYKFWKWANAVEQGIPEDESLSAHENNVKQFAAKVEEVVNEELGEQEIGTEAAQAAKDGITEVLQHLKTGNEAAAAEAAEVAAEDAAIAAEASETAAIAAEGAEGVAIGAGSVSPVGPIVIGIDRGIRKTNDVVESVKTLVKDQPWTWTYARDLLMLIANMRKPF